ncbi:MAG: ribonuclease PH [Endomicrobiia bacterium]|nr:ribonuclease PH [Endomicrobiia bacterium]
MNKIRPIKFETGFLKKVPTAVMVSMGETKVLCVAAIEKNKVPPHCEDDGIGWLSGEYGFLPNAGGERTSRQRANSAGRTKEISRIIGRSLRAAFDLKKIAPHTVTVDCDVIQADGGTRTAAINGGFVAATILFDKLVKEGVYQRIPLKNFIAAVSVGIAGGKKVLDLSAKEDNNADSDINVVMTASGKYVEVQGSAEGRAFSKAEFASLLNMASSGVRKIIAAQKRALKFRGIKF